MKIRLCGITKRHGKRTILNSIESELVSGQLVALVGCNGAGKTTLMKTMATLYGSEGQLLFDDEVVTRGRTDLRAKLHYLSDLPYFLERTPIDHICLAAALYKRSIENLKNKIVDWLRQFDLLEHAERQISSLSRGQQYKAAFIGLLAANPELWLLDEPFAAGVDPTGISAMRRCINKVVGAGNTVVYSTQIVEIAEQFSDRLWVLHNGKLVVDEPTKKICAGGHPIGLSRMFEQLRVAK